VDNGSEILLVWGKKKQTQKTKNQMNSERRKSFLIEELKQF